MKKKTTLELIEQSEKVSLYSISFAVDHTTEFERFLGNGDVKNTATYEEDPKLYGYALDLQKFDKLLRQNIEDGIVTIEERLLTNAEEKDYWI